MMDKKLLQEEPVKLSSDDGAKKQFAKDFTKELSEKKIDDSLIDIQGEEQLAAYMAGEEFRRQEYYM